MYDNIKKNEEIVKELPMRIVSHFANGPYVSIHNVPDQYFKVKMYDCDDLVYEDNVYGDGGYANAFKKYHTDWTIILEKDGKEIFRSKNNLGGRRVMIFIDSKALGDTIAWFPYVEEFRKKHDCEMIACTFHNNLFKEHYPDITFIEPGDQYYDVFAIYNISWYYDGEVYDKFRHPVEFKNQPLQKTATDILGLPYQELKPVISKESWNPDGRYSCIGIHSTSQAKYWNNPRGWQEVVDYLNDQSQEVILLSKESSGYMGNFHPQGITQDPPGDLQQVISRLLGANVYVGMTSGIAWMSWALGVPTVMISGVSYPYCEPQDGVFRVYSPPGTCTGCFNKYKFDPGDWNWCPIYKGTKSEFICTKDISSEDVIEKIKEATSA